VIDQFGSYTLTISKEDSLLDVTPTALGSTPPVPFATDPTEETPDVNRFKCYKARLAKGSRCSSLLRIPQWSMSSSRGAGVHYQKDP